MTPGLVLAVLAAGAVGAVLRYLAALAGSHAAWPWPVLLVNVAGSLIAGAAIHSDAALIVVTVETVQLATEGRWRAATASVAVNIGLGLAAATAGWFLGLALFG
jgi:fluoride exporter